MLNINKLIKINKYNKTYINNIQIPLSIKYQIEIL